jgi:hypothetical protein
MESTNAQKPAKQAKKSSSSAIRVSNETRKRLLSELAKINRKAQGKRVKIDALLGVLLPKLTAKDVLELQEASLSGRDRLEQNFKAYCAKFGAISMDEFLAIISAQAVPQILKGDAAKSESENAT